jgi:hypothetical protein
MGGRSSRVETSEDTFKVVNVDGDGRKMFKAEIAFQDNKIELRKARVSGCEICGKSAEICGNLREFAGICGNLREFEEICGKFAENLQKICGKLRKIC